MMVRSLIPEDRGGSIDGATDTRRVWFELNQKMGMVVNHKRVLRLMREDNLLALQRKQYGDDHRFQATAWR